MKRSHVNMLLTFGLAFALNAAIYSGYTDSQENATPPVKTPDPLPLLPTPEQQKRIDQLIKQLGADDFVDREQAQKDLEKIGLPALTAVRNAAKDPEAEIARRAVEVVTRLEQLLKTGAQLAPKKVNLRLKDAAVADAVADLSKQSGFVIQIGGDKSKLADRKVTLATGDTTFWEAFDLLCLKAGLVEVPADAKAQTGSFQVIDGTPPTAPTCYAGALRIRIVPGSVKRSDGVAEFMLELSVEPRFRQPRVLGAARIDTALDEQSQPLSGLETPSEKPGERHAPAGLRLGANQKLVKELGGTVLFETVLANKVLAIDQVAKNVGKSVANEDGASLRLIGITNNANGDVVVKASMSKQIKLNGGGIQINGNTMAKEFKPELRDANGLPFQFISTNQSSTSISSNGMTANLSMSATFTFRPPPGAGEAAELSLSSDKTTPLTVPFSFKDVTLP